MKLTRHIVGFCLVFVGIAAVSLGYLMMVGGPDRCKSLFEPDPLMILGGSLAVVSGGLLCMRRQR